MTQTSPTKDTAKDTEILQDNGGTDVDPAEFSRTMARIAEHSQALVAEFIEKQKDQETLPLDPLNLGGAFFEMTARLMQDPYKLAQAQLELWDQYVDLWNTCSQRFLNEDEAVPEPAPVITPARGDRRFRDPAWTESTVFDYIKQSYLLTARWVQDLVGSVEGLDTKSAQKVDFYTRQLVDALSPSNFVLTNPEVLKATLDSNGENLIKGLENLLQDLDRGKGRLAISMSDRKAFEVGKNLAVTPGEVVFENHLFQLIQYAPQTEQVQAVPLLIVPPWINKYYILDLQPKNSFVNWAVQQGLTVFMISWVNPDESLSHINFEDYLQDGFLTALDVVKQVTAQPEANVIGYCIGGTLLSMALSVMAARGETGVKSATYMTTLLDFTDAGEISVFIDDEQLANLDEHMKDKGYLDALSLQTSYNMLRANDLIWSFVINNYMLGKDPFPFDLLYWNTDSTNMPAATQSYYLRNMYRDNNLTKPGKMVMKDVPVNVGTVQVPSFFMASRKDHIAPWVSVFNSSQMLGGEHTFVLADSGHVAGVVNHPDAKKYCHWTNAALDQDAEDWLSGAVQHDGSWWPTWAKWLKTRSGPLVTARTPGSKPFPPLEPAPGRYVKWRVV